ncbi:reverse transcriptase domain-containing protein [Tanacetum coccineum]
MKSQQSTNDFVKETFMDLKTQLKTVAKNHQASIQNLETKFDKFADKQSGRPSGSLPSNTQPNPKGHHSKAYQPPQYCNEQVNAVFTRSAVRINVPLGDVLAGMPNYVKFLRELISNKHKIKQISAAFLSDESSAMIQNKVPPKLKDPGSFLIPFNFNKTFFCNALADLGASINLMPYSLYAKLSLKTLKPTKMSVRLADRSFQYPVRIAKNMLVEVGKFTFPTDFIILEIEEDTKVPLILGRPFLHTADAVIRVKQKQLNLRVGTERMIFNIDSAMKHSYSKDDTCFSVDVIDEILEEYFDALLDEGSKILYSIEGTLLEKEIFSEFDKLMAMTADENYDSESDTEEPPFEKITINTDYKIKTSLEEPLMDLELKPLHDNLEYVFLKEPSFLHFEYILVVVDYVSKWDEAQALPTNDARVVITFLKKLLCHFEIPKALISDRGTHFCNKIMERTMKRYGVNHRFSTSYHPQTSGQVENMNRALKRILEKTIKDNPAIWSRKLDDALWAFRTAYKIPTGTTPYKLIYGKNCDLPFEIEHRAYWALKNYNPDLIAAGEKRMFQLHELDELRHQAYENSHLYKARTKVWHDRKLRMRKEFKQGNKVMLFHSKYKFKQPKLRS